MVLILRFYSLNFENSYDVQNIAAHGNEAHIEAYRPLYFDIFYAYFICFCRAFVYVWTILLFL